MFDHAVVGVDFSPGGDAVIRSLTALRPIGTRALTLVHVIAIRYPSPEVGFPPEYAIQRVDEDRRRLEFERQNLEALGFDVTIATPVGDPADCLASAAEDTNASLIVVGSRSHSRATDAFVGSVAWGVVHRSPIPVLVQRISPSPEGRAEEMVANVGEGFELVIHPTDWSPVADAAFERVEALAKTGVIPSFLLLHVRSQLAETRRGQSTEQEDRQRLEELAGRLRAAGAADVRMDTPSGAAFLEIVKRAEASDRSLVVMGTRGRGLFSDAVLGSVSRETLRKSRGAVLLVPAR